MTTQTEGSMMYPLIMASVKPEQNYGVRLRRGLRLHRLHRRNPDIHGGGSRQPLRNSISRLKGNPHLLDPTSQGCKGSSRHGVPHKASRRCHQELGHPQLLSDARRRLRNHRQHRILRSQGGEEGGELAGYPRTSQFGLQRSTRSPPQATRSGTTSSSISRRTPS